MSFDIQNKIHNLMVNILAAMNDVFYRSLIDVVEKIPWFLTNIILNVSEHRQQEYDIIGLGICTNI